jgi:hypothetical protein
LLIQEFVQVFPPEAVLDLFLEKIIHGVHSFFRCWPDETPVS